ncbi:MAG: hypothetical protein KC503_38980, partial [Myxococcales bacterium]|nr:hypothetical protein [Myxococcales bacterium]
SGRSLAADPLEPPAAQAAAAAAAASPGTPRSARIKQLVAQLAKRRDDPRVALALARAHAREGDHRGAYAVLRYALDWAKAADVRAAMLLELGHAADKLGLAEAARRAYEGAAATKGAVAASAQRAKRALLARFGY